MKLLIFIFLILILIQQALGIGVAQEFLINDTLTLHRGEERIFVLTLQNSENKEVDVQFDLSGQIAELNETTNIFNLPPKTYDYKIKIKIKVPEDAKAGDNYHITYSAKPISIMEDVPPIGIGVKITRNINVKVIDESKGNVTKKDVEPSPKKNKFLIIGTIVVIILLLLFLWKRSLIFSDKILKNKK